MINLKVLIGSTKINYNLISLILALTCVHLSISQIISSEPISGWDTPGHLYLTYKMQEFLGLGTWFGYDSSWFSGTALFVLYPPLTYILINILHLITFSSDLTYSFNLFIYLQAQLLVIIFYWITKYILGVEYRKYVMLVLTLMLHTNIIYSTHFIGLAGLFYAGFLSNCTGLILFLLLFAQIRKLELNIISSSYTSILILSLILLNHIISAIFTLIFISIYLALQGNSRVAKKWFAVIAVASLVASPYYWIFIANLEFSSSEAIGLHGSFPDPLLVLFPNLNIEHFVNMFNAEFSDTFSFFNYKIELPLIISQFPYYALIAFYFGIKGSLLIVKSQKKLLGFLFTITILFIFLPRAYLTNLTSLTIHYYRFTGLLSFMFIFIIASGIKHSDYTHSNLKKILGGIFLALILLLTTSYQMLFISDSRHQEFKLHLSDYQGYQNLDKVAKYLKENNLTAGVAIEQSYNFLLQVGSLHAVSYLFPHKYKIPIKTGLLAESAYYSSLINPTLGLQTNHMVWGSKELYLFNYFNNPKKNPNLFIEKLRLLGVKVLITTDRDSFKKIKTLTLQNRFLVLNKKIANYAIFVLPELSLKKTNSIKPRYLFFDSKELAFKMFFRDWFAYDSTINFNLVYDYFNLTQKDPSLLSQFSGLVFSAENTNSCLKNYEKLKSLQGDLNEKLIPLIDQQNQQQENPAIQKHKRDFYDLDIIFLGKKCFKDPNWKVKWIKTNNPEERMAKLTKLVQKNKLKILVNNRLINTEDTFSPLNGNNSFIQTPFFTLKVR